MKWKMNLMQSYHRWKSESWDAWKTRCSWWEETLKTSHYNKWLVWWALNILKNLMQNLWKSFSNYILWKIFRHPTPDCWVTRQLDKMPMISPTFRCTAARLQLLDRLDDHLDEYGTKNERVLYRNLYRFATGGYRVRRRLWGGKRFFAFLLFCLVGILSWSSCLNYLH